MGDKNKPPPLPKGAPKDLKDFVDCTSARLTWRQGKVDWLKLQDLLPKDFPGKDWLPDDAKPEVTFEKAADGGVKVGIGVAGLTILSLPASVKDGKLSIDTSSVPDVGGAPAAVKKWVDDLNAVVTDNGKQLSGLTLKDGTATLEKSARTASVGPGRKVAAAGFALAGVAAGLGLMNVGDSATVNEVSVTQAPTTGAPSPLAPDTTAPAEAASGEPQTAQLAVWDGAFGTFHVGPGNSFLQVCISVPTDFDGNYRAIFGQTPSGRLVGSGQVTDGLGLIQVPINQYGTYGGFRLLGPDGSVIDNLGPLAGQLPWVVTQTSDPCDPASLETAPAPIADTASSEPIEDSAAPVAEPPPPPVVTTSVSESTTDAPAWSLLFIPGGLLIAGGLLLPWGRRPTGGHTVERPGTGDPDAVAAPEYVPDPNAPPIGFSDGVWQLLQQQMAYKQEYKEGRFTSPIRVVAGEDTWFTPDSINALDSGDKVALAFNDLAEGHKLGDEFKDALWALASAESVVFFGSVVAIQLLPGVNVAVDITLFLILLAYLGEFLSDFIDGLIDAGKAVNKQQLDHAETKIARAIAGVGTAAITALVGKIAGKAAGKLRGKPPVEDIPTKGRNPEFSKGGVHEALPAEKPTSKPDFTKGGVHEAIPAEGTPAEPVDPGKTAQVNPEDFGHDAGEGMSKGEQLKKAYEGVSDPNDPPRNPITDEPMIEVDEEPVEPEYNWNADKMGLGPEEQAAAMEVRMRNYDKAASKGMSAAERAHYDAVRANDVNFLRNAGPEFWDGVTDPQTRAYLQSLVR